MRFEFEPGHLGDRYDLHGAWVKFRVRGVPARDISSLRAFGPGGGPILRVVRAACALLEVFREKCNLAYPKRYFSGEMCVWLKPDARFSKKRVFGLSQTLRFGEGARNIYIYI